MIELERPWPSRLQATDTVLFFGFRWGFARRCGVPHATRPRAACTRCADDARGILVAILEDFPEVKIALSTSWVRLLSRYQQIRAATCQAGLTRWVALDDDPFESWPAHESRLIRSDPDLGLSWVPTQDEWREKLHTMMRDI